MYYSAIQTCHHVKIYKSFTNNKLTKQICDIILIEYPSAGVNIPYARNNLGLRYFRKYMSFGFWDMLWENYTKKSAVMCYSVFTAFRNTFVEKHLVFTSLVKSGGHLFLGQSVCSSAATNIDCDLCKALCSNRRQF